MSKRIAAVVITVSAVLMLGAVFLASALYTDRSEFCKSCHEMTPHYDAWASGPHEEVPCIDCHVEPGLPARFAHKFVALGEVWSHFTGDTLFPRATPPEIPDARCIRCHEDLPQKTDKRGFDHKLHASKGGCAQCHYTTGHEVTDAALENAGVLAPDVTPKRLIAKYAAVGTGRADLTGHTTVTCSACHDMKATPCESCHARPTDKEHPATGECTSCHPAATPNWRFDHPSAGEHSWQSRPCEKCHPSSYDRVSCTCH